MRVSSSIHHAPSQVYDVVLCEYFNFQPGRKKYFLNENDGVVGELGLIDTNYCLWNGLAMRSCCIAQGTIYLITCDGT